jgi:hypothetical protein
MARCKGKTHDGSRCRRSSESKYCWQHSSFQIGGFSQIGGNNNFIKFHCYIQLNAEQQNYQADTNRLVANYQRIDPQAMNNFNFVGQPKTKHITILDFDITMNDQAIRSVSNYRLGNFQDSSGLVDKRTFGRFRQTLFGQIKQITSQTIKGLFKNYPAETTASLYPSRYDKKGPYVAVIFRTDLAFIDLIIPSVQSSLQQFAIQHGFQIQVSQFFVPLNNVILHMSLGKELSPNARVAQSRITSDIAKNYAISKSNIDNLLQIEGTSNIELL